MTLALQSSLSECPAFIRDRYLPTRVLVTSKGYCEKRGFIMTSGSSLFGPIHTKEFCEGSWGDVEVDNVGEGDMIQGLCVLLKVQGQGQGVV
jgi:hypothetical protein